MQNQLAHCTSLPLSEPAKEFRLIPSGLFRAIDGRPGECEGWLLDRIAAQNIVRQSNARSTDRVIDYEHQTIASAKNGMAAPAAGWFKRMEWREGDGLYVIDARWTARATAMIKAQEYRFISPVFTYDKTGKVVDVLHAALTNNPALDGLTELAAASCVLHGTATAADIAKAACAYQDSMAAKGVHITTVQAVRHVSPVSAALSADNRQQQSASVDKSAAIADAICTYQKKMQQLGIYVTTAQAARHVAFTSSTHHERNSHEI